MHRVEVSLGPQVERIYPARAVTLVAGEDLVVLGRVRGPLPRTLTLKGWLAGRRYVAGDQFTMGDIPLGTAVQRWFNLPIERENFRNLEAYYRRLQARAAFKQLVDVLPLT